MHSNRLIYRLRSALVACAVGACGASTDSATSTPTNGGDAGAVVDGGVETTDAASVDASPVADARIDADANANADADANACPGCGFWDPDFSIGTWRTDFDDPNAGTAAKPLTLDACPYVIGSDPEVLNGAGPTYYDENKSVAVACDRQSTTYAVSNASTSSPTWPLDRYWVISANNERSYGAEGSCSDSGPNTGPPNQSKKVFAPSKGVFGVDVSAGKATLAIDTNAFPNCVAAPDKGKIPFLSIGAQTERGQKNQPITYLNDARYPATLGFQAKLEDIAPSGVASSLGKARANFAYVFIEAQWGGMRRWAYIDLLARTTSLPELTRAHWNWNMRESMWYPGAEIVYVSADQLASMCADPKIVAGSLIATPGASYDYSLDLNALFRCFSSLPAKGWSTPLPSTPMLPITGVHWAIEQTYGKNWTTLSIQKLRLTH